MSMKQDSPQDFYRYHRQIQFDKLGEEGQRRLRTAKVALVGCGGLGSHLAQFMVRSGIGAITIIDGDKVDLSNLHRQFLYNESEATNQMAKALVARDKLRAADSGVTVIGVAETLTSSNVDRLLANHDLVLDGTDNLTTRHLINDWCVQNTMPWIYGGIKGATGMSMVILPNEGPCLRCLYPTQGPEEIQVSSPETMPVINTIPAAVAAFQATEAIKLLINSPDLITSLRIIDLWTGDFQTIPIDKDPQCQCCGKREFTFLT